MPRVEDQLGVQRAYLLKRYPKGTAIGDDIRRMPPVSGDIGSGGFKDISVLKLTQMAKQMGNHPLMSLALGQARVIRNDLFAWITSYSIREKTPGMGFEEFKRDWRIFRVWCPLQVRLAVEEIFWELGGPYRKLITGFAPIKD